MKRIILLLVAVLLCFACSKTQYRSINMDTYVDKMKAAWIGQMAGVGWGAPTEFKYHGQIIPADKVPDWDPEMINCFGQDDLYVEMTFLHSLQTYGIDCDIIDAGIDFANSEYQLWGANKEGRDNMRAGIAPPASSHPRFNHGADWIDYQIEADFSGIIAPGLPNTAVKLGETFGRLMNYGDGLYAGQFVGAMYAHAFFDTDIDSIIAKSLRSIPYNSQYAECMRDVVKWHQEDPVNWQNTWAKIEAKYFQNPDYQQYLAVQPKYWSPMDAKLNGAFILMGLLYGNGDPDSTIVISMRCGRDSDCNPSSAAGILFTSIGYKDLPAKYTRALCADSNFSYTNYSFDGLTRACVQLAQQFVKQSGGKIVTDKDGARVMLIPERTPYISDFVQSWQPEPFTGDSLLTDAQYARVKYYAGRQFASLMHSWPVFRDNGYQMDFCGKASSTEFVSWQGRDQVLQSVADNPHRGVVIRSELDSVQPNQTLSFWVSHQDGQAWQVSVLANWQTVAKELVSKETCTNGWKQINVDLSPFAGDNVSLQITQQSQYDVATTAYWSDFKLK